MGMGVCVREDQHNEQMGKFWVATLRGSWGGNALDGNLYTMNRPWWRSINSINSRYSKYSTVLHFRSRTLAGTPPPQRTVAFDPIKKFSVVRLAQPQHEAESEEKKSASISFVLCTVLGTAVD